MNYVPVEFPASSHCRSHPGLPGAPQPNDRDKPVLPENFIQRCQLVGPAKQRSPRFEDLKRRCDLVKESFSTFVVRKIGDNRSLQPPCNHTRPKTYFRKHNPEFGASPERFA